MKKQSKKLSDEEIGQLAKFFEILVEIDQKQRNAKRQIQKIEIVARDHRGRKGF